MEHCHEPEVTEHFTRSRCRTRSRDVPRTGVMAAPNFDAFASMPGMRSWSQSRSLLPGTRIGTTRTPYSEPSPSGSGYWKNAYFSKSSQHSVVICMTLLMCCQDSTAASNSFGKIIDFPWVTRKLKKGLDNQDRTCSHKIGPETPLVKFFLKTELFDDWWAKKSSILRSFCHYSMTCMRKPQDIGKGVVRT